MKSNGACRNPIVTFSRQCSSEGFSEGSLLFRSSHRSLTKRRTSPPKLVKLQVLKFKILEWCGIKLGPSARKGRLIVVETLRRALSMFCRACGGPGFLSIIYRLNGFRIEKVRPEQGGENARRELQMSSSLPAVRTEQPNLLNQAVFD